MRSSSLDGRSIYESIHDEEVGLDGGDLLSIAAEARNASTRAPPEHKESS